MSRAASKGIVDANTDQSRYIMRRIGYAHASDYFRDFLSDSTPSMWSVHQAILLDRSMQSTILEYIGLFELQFRTQYAYHLSQEAGPFAHRDPDNYKNLEHFNAFLKDYEREFNRQLSNRSQRAAAGASQYGDVPIWQAVEFMTFGMLSKLYRNTRNKRVRIEVADSFGVDYDTLVSWMRTIAYVRNRCAHFGKLLGTKLTSMPRKIPGISLANSNPFYVVLMLERLLSAPSYFTDDMSLMYTVSLVKDISETICASPPAVAMKYIPINWRTLVTSRTVTEAEVNLEIEVMADPRTARTGA